MRYGAPLGQTVDKWIIFIILHGKSLSHVNLVIAACRHGCRRLIIVLSQFAESAVFYTLLIYWALLTVIN